MICSHESCGINLDMLLISIDSGKEQLVFCPNHMAMHVYEQTNNLRRDRSLLTEPIGLCHACGEQGDVVYTTFKRGEERIHITLCNRHFEDLVMLNLDESAYFNLVEIFGVFHEIHDDFYDPEDGYALQSREN